MTSDDRLGPTPEDEGVPDYADDTSTAFNEQDRPRFNDSPYPVPGREPEALDEFGLTAEEQRRGESIDQRLAREEPDFGAAGSQPPEGGPAEEAAVRTVDEDDLTSTAYSEDQPTEDIGPEPTGGTGSGDAAEGLGRVEP